MIMPIALNFNSYTKTGAAPNKRQNSSPHFGQGLGLENLGSISLESSQKVAKYNLLSIIRETDIREKKSICDFGCGTGGPTMALKEIFNPDCIVAVDQKNYYKAPDKSIIFKCCDGIGYLASGQKKFDLIAAQMLVPSVDTREFLKAAYQSLNRNGQILIYSDEWTMYDLEDNLRLQGIKGFKSCKTDFRLPAVLIDKKELDDRFGARPQYFILP